MSSLRALLYVVLCVGMIAVQGQAVAQEISLTPSVTTSQEGFLSLSWQGSSELPPATLEVAVDATFSALQRTVPLNRQIVEKSQVHISGFADGQYYARLVAASGQPVSTVATFSVAHRDLTVAFGIFAVGAAMFVALIVVMTRFISRGNEHG